MFLFGQLLDHELSALFGAIGSYRKLEEKDAEAIHRLAAQ
jgi:hypothetical protein